MSADVRGYVLTGGRSSRMGVDKAELRLGGRTLLEIAVRKLQGICTEVVISGQRERVPSGVRVLQDVWPDCGPMGGMVAALRDAGANPALFLPVDMPLLPQELLARMAEVWLRSAAPVCFAVTDGRAQPLLSLLRFGALREMEAALARGEYKVRPVLEAAGKGCGGVLRTEISTSRRDAGWPGWLPGDAEWDARELWFANLNTPEEFAAAERVFSLPVDI